MEFLWTLCVGWFGLGLRFDVVGGDFLLWLLLDCLGLLMVLVVYFSVMFVLFASLMFGCFVLVWLWAA